MAKKAKAKTNTPKARAKQLPGSPKQAAAKAAEPQAEKPAAPRPAAQPSAPASKYDQPGAPWWKKFRPESGAGASKR